MTPRGLEEYRELRATIRERGTTRVWVFVAGLMGWGALAIATAALAALPVATLLPLLVLAGMFEAVFALHTGVERVGRYLQVYVESATDPGWEQVAMAYGRAFPGGGPDPLFTVFFGGAMILNFVPALLAGPMQPIEWIVIGTAHLLFLVRLVAARRQAAQQRRIDLERFEKLRQQ